MSALPVSAEMSPVQRRQGKGCAEPSRRGDRRLSCLMTDLSCLRQTSGSSQVCDALMLGGTGWQLCALPSGCASPNGDEAQAVAASVSAFACFCLPAVTSPPPPCLRIPRRAHCTLRAIDRWRITYRVITTFSHR
jgi:hypothetical protein